MTFSKIKKLCGVVFIPRILGNQVTLSPQKMGKRPLGGFWKLAKSTDAKDRNAKREKCKKLIELVLGNEKPDNPLKQVEVNIQEIKIDKVQKVTAPNVAVNAKSHESNVLTLENTKQGFESTEKLSAKRGTNLPLDNLLQSTTAKTNEEQLAQKLETIEEPGLVEAAAPKIEGFNVPPKVLGSQESIKKSLCTKIAPDEVEVDKIAKKCLRVSPDKIDERILEEMKNCGMLGRGRKKASSRTGRPIATKCIEKESMLHTKSYNTNEPNNATMDQNEEKTTSDNNKTRQHQQKTKLFSSCDSAVVDTIHPVINDHLCNANIKEPEQVITKKVIKEEERLTDTDTLTEIIENVEGEIEEIRVTAMETNRLGTPGESEIEPDFNYKHTSTKSDVGVKNMEPDKYENVALMKSEFLSNWNFRPDTQQFPYKKSNTSGIYPPGNTSYPESPHNDSAISAHQDPGEYYDLSNCKIEKGKDEYAISISEIEIPYAFAAYHQYTLVTGTDEEENSENVLLTLKETPEVLTSVWENMPLFEKQDLPNTIDKNISSAMGPLPQLKDMEEETSLTEMLRRVRETNRLEYCRECAFKALEVAPVETANKCPPPPDKDNKCKPKSSPKPCPKPPPCPPPAKTSEPQCPSPCKPKDPCAKCASSLIADKIKEIFTLVFQVAFKPTVPAQSSFSYNFKMNAIKPFKQIYNNNTVEKLDSFLTGSLERENKYFGIDVILAKDYGPWSPIPSWPIPKKEKKKPFVCPKEGCKIIPPPRLLDPCGENPCKNLPKRSISFEFDYEPMLLYNEF